MAAEEFSSKIPLRRSFIKRQEKEAARVIDGNPISVEHAEIMDMLKAIANKVEYAENKEA